LAVRRLLLALLIAVGVTLAPVGAAMAALAEASAGMTDMPDCPSKAKQTSTDCGCCDTKAAPCQADFCLAKCFKLNGEIVRSAASLQWARAAFVTAAPTRPPDSWPEPDARPPRT
jgi:hypothetical protein